MPSGSRWCGSCQMSSRGCNSGEAGQRFWCGEAGAAGADLGEQSCGADAAGAGQAGEDVRIGVQGQLFVDLDRQGFDLFAHSAQHGQKRSRDVGFGGSVFADGTAWCGGQAGVEDRSVGAAAVADAGQPSGESFGREPVGAVLAVEAVQECQADLAVDVSEESDAPGKTRLRCSRSWLARLTWWATRSLRARQARRSVQVSGLSGVNGRSRARSVRRASASTKASKRSSLLPAEP